MIATKYRIDVYIADDHALLNECLTQTLNQKEAINVSRSFTTFAQCRAAIMERCPDVLLLDVSMPDGDGAEFCQWVIQEYPKVKVVAVTVHDEYSLVQRMLDSGVHGYVLKSASVDELKEAIISVWQGRRYVSPEIEEIIRKGKETEVVLTPVEENILRLICAGDTNPQIAEKLRLSQETVRWYRKRLFAKYGVNNAVSLATLALREKIV